ncbi:MAG TPA: Wzz/FepE/Etk N-terminal domain-containing protein [Povalibacter sp.]|jgi:chain length determinant protein EpsF|nr:Wzz/FepE/Etk N-terminal domain-containing protein [Povalibacter sp.]
MTFQHMLRILWVRRGLVMSVIGVAMALTIVSWLIRPATYVATASVVVDARGVDPLTGNASNSLGITSVLATQEDIITSRAVALQVVDMLHLENKEDRSRQAWAATLNRNLKVKPEAQSSVLRLSYADEDPEFAAQVANAFADAYLQTSLDLKLEPTRRQSEWFNQQLQGLRTRVESEQENLSDYQREHGVLDAGANRLDVENARLASISDQLVEAQRVQQAAEARLRQADVALRSDRLNELPDSMSNGLLQSLKGEQIRAQAKLADLSERYARNHPQIIAANAEIASLNQRISAEMQALKGSLQQSAQIARQQVADLQRSFDAQKSHILQLTQQRDEMSVRNREVETAQSAYANALQRSTQLKLESQLNQANAAVLDRANPPQHPDGLGLIAGVVLAIMFGGMLGVAIALGLEMLDRRVRDGDELTLAGVQVLAEVPRLRGGNSGARKLIGFKGGPQQVLEGKPA